MLDSNSRTTGAGQPGQQMRGRTAYTGKPDRTAETGQQRVGSRNRTARTGQARQDSQTVQTEINKIMLPITLQPIVSVSHDQLTKKTELRQKVTGPEH